ncbi:MAG TPA: PEGA domain-containing protein [Planctomycetes bacterium]|nr:PEGA domain-containing protein [Planctomycetota bacterium]
MGEFIARLVQTGLMSRRDIETFQEGLAPGQRPRDAKALAGQLVRAGRLTRYQAAAVYQGKTKALVLGEYVVLDRIGAGGMGQVFRARHRQMDRVVAVKVLPPDAMGSAEAIKRFRREMRAAAKLMHPNIVAAYDAGEHQGIHYLVMEWVDGKDLAQVTKQRGTIPVPEAVGWILQAARGLEYAHQLGVVHRDIKPGNLLLDRQGTVKVLDMGLARMFEGREETAASRLTATGQVMGTIDYMAPEQSEDTHHADARADIYSLGCTLYRLLTGRSPYAADSLVGILLAHRDAPIPSLRAARPEVSAELDAVFQKMLAKRPEDRYQSMAEVITALEACLSEVEQPASAVAQGARKDPALSSFLRGLSQPGVASHGKLTRGAEETLGRPMEHEKATSGQRFYQRLLAPRRRKPLYAVAAVVALLAVSLGIVIVLSASRGTLVLQVDTPGAKVVIDGGKLTITTPEDAQPVTVQLEEGEHTLRVTKDGLQTVTRRFTIRAGGKQTVRVRLAAPKSKGTTVERGAAASAEAPRQGLPLLDQWPSAPPEKLTLDDLRVLFPLNAAIGGTSKCELAVTALHPAVPINDVGWSSNGRLIATACVDRTVRLWRPDGTAGPVLQGHAGIVMTVAWSPDGQRVASGGADGTVRLWQPDGTPGPVLKGHSSQVQEVAWSPDGRRLASAGDDGTVRLWQTDGTPGPVLQGHRGTVYCVDWSPDGSRLGSAGADKTVHLWDARSAESLFVLKPHGNAVYSLSFAPDGGRLAAGTWGRISIWDLVERRLHTQIETQSWADCLCYSSDGALIAWGTKWGQVAVLAVGSQAKRYEVKTPARVHGIAFSPDDSRVVLGTEKGTLLALDAATGELQWAAVLLLDDKSVTFDGSGSVLDGDPQLIERLFAYCLKKPDQRTEIIKPSEFRKRSAENDPKKRPVTVSSSEKPAE